MYENMAGNMSENVISENHKIKKIFEFDGIEFWLVSGNKVHSMFDHNWKNDIGEGGFTSGHHYAFKYIPENDIWVSDLDKEPYRVVVREYIEILLMRDENMSHGSTRTVTSKIESLQRYVDDKIYA